MRAVFEAAKAPIVWEEQFVRSQEEGPDPATNSFVTRANLDSVLVKALDLAACWVQEYLGVPASTDYCCVPCLPLTRTRILFAASHPVWRFDPIEPQFWLFSTGNGRSEGCQGCC
jgi:hypothetical protein